MIYLNLSVNDIAKSIFFYRDVLGIFDVLGGDRLVCKSKVDLILDLNELDTEQHFSIYESHEHVLSSFSLHLGEQDILKLKEALGCHNIVHEYSHNIAGKFLKFSDPSGNKIHIVTQ